MCVCVLRVGQFGAGLGDGVCSKWLCVVCVCVCDWVCVSVCVFVCAFMCVAVCVFVGVCVCVLRARVCAACGLVWSSLVD